MKVKVLEGRQQVQSFILSFTDVGLIFGNESLKTTVFKDGKLQLLLKLMGAERIGERGIPSQTLG